MPLNQLTQTRESGVCLFVGCLTSQQQASVSQGRICSDNFTCCHTEIEVADQTFYLTQSQYTDTGPTSPSADPITPGAWQGSVALSAHTHTHMVFSMKEAASGATLPIPSTLSITTNSDSLVEFFIHPCKFLKYSISFSFNKIKFLLSPKIHHYSLKAT